MGAGTFALELATGHARAAVYASVQGWGRRIGATTASLDDTYRFSSLDPTAYGYTANEGDPYHSALTKLPDATSEYINYTTGQTVLGRMGLDLADIPGKSGHGWDDDYLITDLLSPRAGYHASHAATSGQWELSADCAKGAATCTVVAATGISVGDALWIGAEAVIVTSIAAAPVLSIDRGCYDTPDQEHLTNANGGEGLLFDRPKYIKGRKVTLYVNLFDSRTGDIMAEAQDHQLWQGIVSDWSCAAEERKYEILCSPILGDADRMIGWDQFQATARILLSKDDAQSAMAERLEQGITPTLPTGEGAVAAPLNYTEAAGVATFYARFGKQIVLAQYYTQTMGGVESVKLYRLLDYGLLGSEVEAEEKQQTFREVFLIHPDPGDSAASALELLQSPDGEPTAHPALILLSLLSTGSGGLWDTGLDQWGVGIDESDIDLDSFYMAAHSTDISLPNLVLGWDGKPFKLREWAEEEILGPLGWFLYQTSEGKIGLGWIQEPYPSDAATTLDESLIVPGTMQYSGQLGSSAGQTTWEYDWDWAEEQPRQTIIFRSREVLERDRHSDTGHTYKLKSGAPDGGTAAALRSKGVRDQRLWSTPLPSVSFDVPIASDTIDLHVTSMVSITHSAAPNPFTGGRGLVAVPGTVVGKGLDLAQGVISLTVMLLSQPNHKYFAPAARVVSYAAGPPLIITIAANDYTAVDADERQPQVEQEDGDAFSAGDIVALVDLYGAFRSDNVVTVVAASSTTIEIDTGFTLAAAPVVPVASDRVIYARYSAAAVPSSVWTTHMELHVAQANSATGLLTDGSAATEYGS